MAAVTVVAGTKANKLPLGPINMEVVNITIAADQDTYTTVMQNPQFAFFVANTDGNTTQLGVNAAVSGRVVTLNDSNISSTTGTLVVFGF